MIGEPPEPPRFTADHADAVIGAPDVDGNAPPVRPRIFVRRPELYEVVGEAAAALASSDRFYRQGGRLVHLAESEGGGLEIAAVGAHHLRVELSAVAEWVVLAKQDGEFVEKVIQPPLSVAQELLDSREFTGLRRLRGVVTAPTLRPDGSVVQRDGYDATSGLFLATGRSYPAVPRAPGRADAAAALRALDEVVADFPFATDADRSGWLALVLTLAGRHAIDGPVPLVAVDAPTPGTGKTLAAQVAGCVVYGKPLDAEAAPPDDVEMRKKITATAMAGKPAVLLDNIAGKIGWPSLDLALTSTSYSDRILGSPHSWEGRLTTTWVATSNNATWSADVLRRTLRVRLVPEVERPEERAGFRHPDLAAWAKREHPRLLVAALTVLRAFLLGGEAPALPSWGSFEDWSRVVRGALVWAGRADPADTRADLRGLGDLKRAALARLIAAWPPGSAVTVNDLLHLAGHNRALRDALVEFASRNDEVPSTRQVGAALARSRDAVVDGRRIVQAGADHKTTLWTVRSIEVRP